jgi:hypothetical protein
MTIFSFAMSALAQFLDPVRFIIIFLVCVFSKNKWIILIAAIIGAVSIETILKMSQITRVWGSGLTSGFLASFFHAVICYKIVNKVKKLYHNKSSSNKS